MTENTDTVPQELSGRLHWYHWVVVGASLVLTFSAWYVTSRQAEQKIQNQFNYQADQIVQLVKERMGKYEEALWAGVAALHAMPANADRSNWRTFASSLKIESRFPGINGIGVIHYVDPDTMEQYLVRQRREMPDYAIHPRHDKNEFWPITYIEPQSINAKAVGLDMAHESNRYTAAIKTRDTGTAQITAPIILVQDARQTPGFLFFVPWYHTAEIPSTREQRRQHLQGLVYSPFIMYKLMDGVLANTNRQVNFSIHDGNVELYNELNNESENFDPNPLLTTEISLNLYGRPWRFTVQSTSIFREQNTQTQPLMILVGGLIIDSMLFALFIVLARANKKARSYADRTTADLRKKAVEFETTHSRLSSAMNAMMDGLVVIDEFGTILEINSATLNMFGFGREELLEKNVKILMAAVDAEQHDAYLCRKTPPENNSILGKKRIFQAKRADGTMFPIRLSVTRIRNEEDIFYTGVIHDLSALSQSQ